MCRSRFLPLTFVLAMVTAVALLGAGSALSVAPAPAARTDDGEDSVRRFYDAVNDVLGGGAATDLDRVVDAEFVAHDALLGAASGRATFADHLHELRAIYPALQIGVDDVVVAGDLATVRLSPRGADHGTFLGLPLDRLIPAWEAIDLIRLADGKAAERWGVGDAPPRLQPLGSAPVEAPPATWVGVALERLTLAAGARASGSSYHSTVMIAVDAGTIRFRVHEQGPREHSSAGNAAAADGGSTSTDLTIGAGDRLVVPDDVEFTVENAGGTPAVALGVRLATGVSYPRSVLLKARTDEDGSPSAAWPMGVSVERLANGPVPGAGSGQTSVAFGRATLAPGTEIGLGRMSGSAMLVVEAGTLGLETSGGTASVRRGDSGAAAEAPAGSLTAGDRALVQTTDASVLRNAGPGPLVVLLVAAVPEAV